MRLTLLALAALVVMTIFSEIQTHSVSTLYQWIRADLSETASGTVKMAGASFRNGSQSEPLCNIIYSFVARAGASSDPQLTKYLGEQKVSYGKCEKFSVGDTITVYFNPQNPTHSALEQASLGSDFWLEVGKVLLISLCLVFALEFGTGIGGDGGCGGGGD